MDARRPDPELYPPDNNITCSSDGMVVDVVATVVVSLAKESCNYIDA